MSAQPNQPNDDQPEGRRPFSTLLSSLTPNSDNDQETTATEDTSVENPSAEDTSAEDTGVAPRPTFTAREDIPEAPATGIPTTGKPSAVAGLDPVDDTTDEPVTGTVYEAEPADYEPLDDAADEEPVIVRDEDLTAADRYGEPADDAATAGRVPPAPRAGGEALPGFRRASTDGDGARAFPRHATSGTAGVIDEPVTGTTPEVPVSSARPGTSASLAGEPLLSDAADFRARWQQTQAWFVDDPREAVGEAADLIEQTAQALVVAVRQRQRQLRESWDKAPEAHGTDPASTADTEQLRLMMQRYRALFNQLCRP